MSAAKKAIILRSRNNNRRLYSPIQQNANKRQTFKASLDDGYQSIIDVQSIQISPTVSYMAPTINNNKGLNDNTIESPQRDDSIVNILSENRTISVRISSFNRKVQRLEEELPEEEREVLNTDTIDYDEKNWQLPSRPKVERNSKYFHQSKKVVSKLRPRSAPLMSLSHHIAKQQSHDESDLQTELQLNITSYNGHSKDKQSEPAIEQAAPNHQIKEKDKNELLSNRSDTFHEINHIIEPREFYTKPHVVVPLSPYATHQVSLYGKDKKTIHFSPQKDSHLMHETALLTPQIKKKNLKEPSSSLPLTSFKLSHAKQSSTTQSLPNHGSMIPFASKHTPVESSTPHIIPNQTSEEPLKKLEHYLSDQQKNHTHTKNAWGGAAMKSYIFQKKMENEWYSTIPTAGKGDFKDKNSDLEGGKSEMMRYSMSNESKSCSVQPSGLMEEKKVMEMDMEEKNQTALFKGEMKDSFTKSMEDEARLSRFLTLSNDATESNLSHQNQHHALDVNKRAHDVAIMGTSNDSNDAPASKIIRDMIHSQDVPNSPTLTLHSNRQIYNPDRNRKNVNSSNSEGIKRRPVTADAIAKSRVNHSSRPLSSEISSISPRLRTVTAYRNAQAESERRQLQLMSFEERKVRTLLDQEIRLANVEQLVLNLAKAAGSRSHSANDTSKNHQQLPDEQISYEKQVKLQSAIPLNHEENHTATASRNDGKKGFGLSVYDHQDFVAARNATQLIRLQRQLEADRTLKGGAVDVTLMGRLNNHQPVEGEGGPCFSDELEEEEKEMIEKYQDEFHENIQGERRMDLPLTVTALEQEKPHYGIEDVNLLLPMQRNMMEQLRAYQSIIKQRRAVDHAKHGMDYSHKTPVSIAKDSHDLLESAEHHRWNQWKDRELFIQNAPMEFQQLMLQNAVIQLEEDQEGVDLDRWDGNVEEAGEEEAKINWHAFLETPKFDQPQLRRNNPRRDQVQFAIEDEEELEEIKTKPKVRNQITSTSDRFEERKSPSGHRQGGGMIDEKYPNYKFDIPAEEVYDPTDLHVEPVRLSVQQNMNRSSKRIRPQTSTGLNRTDRSEKSTTESPPHPSYSEKFRPQSANDSLMHRTERLVSDKVDATPFLYNDSQDSLGDNNHGYAVVNNQNKGEEVLSSRRTSIAKGSDRLADEIALPYSKPKGLTNLIIESSDSDHNPPLSPDALQPAVSVPLPSERSPFHSSRRPPGNPILFNGIRPRSVGGSGIDAAKIIKKGFNAYGVYGGMVQPVPTTTENPITFEQKVLTPRMTPQPLKASVPMLNLIKPSDESQIHNIFLDNSSLLTSHTTTARTDMTRESLSFHKDTNATKDDWIESFKDTPKPVTTVSIHSNTNRMPYEHNAERRESAQDKQIVLLNPNVKSSRLSSNVHLIGELAYNLQVTKLREVENENIPRSWQRTNDGMIEGSNENKLMKDIWTNDSNNNPSENVAKYALFNDITNWHTNNPDKKTIRKVSFPKDEKVQRSNGLDIESQRMILTSREPIRHNNRPASSSSTRPRSVSFGNVAIKKS